MKKIGIDPGQTGAIAVMEDGVVVKVFDMPVMGRLHGEGHEVDASSLAAELFDIGTGTISEVVLEQVDGRPKKGPNGPVKLGSTSIFNFGEGFGIIKGVLGALQIPVRMVSPGKWKASAGLTRKDKDAARSLAIQLHPEAAEYLRRKKDVGRADAICIARFG